MDAQTDSEADAPRPSRESGRAKVQAFELKGVVAPLTALRLRTADMGVIAKQLLAKVAQMPQFFQDAPVLVDLAALGEDAGRVHFGALASLLRSHKMVPVAVTNAEGDVRARAAQAGFGYVPPSAPRTGGRTVELSKPLPTEAAPAPAHAKVPPVARRTASAPPSTATAPEEPSARPARATHRPPLVVRQPVRSGQTIYAEGTDLVLLAPVNSGAEVIADGHVHIYSTLRGRAVAGARGMTDARIFCQKLDAEFVAIAGAYVLSDDLPPEHRGKPVQIYLEDGICRVTAL
jgi:septum site-determining protein MinC